MGKINKQALPAHKAKMLAELLSVKSEIRKEKNEKKVKRDLPKDIMMPSSAHTLSHMAINWKYSQKSAAEKLCYAARWYQIPMLRRLLKKHPDLVNQCGVLATACLNGHAEIVKILVNEFHADVNFKDDEEGYPIHSVICSHSASTSTRLEIIDFLIENGANIHHQGSFYNETAIQICLRYLKNHGEINVEYLPVLKRLIAAGGNVHESHLLSSCSLSTIYSEMLKKDPAIFKQIEEIITGSQSSSDDGLVSLMSNMKLQPDSLDSLFIAFASLSTEPVVTASHSSRPL